MIRPQTPLWTKSFIGIALINVLLFLGWQMQLSSLPIFLRELSGSDTIVGVSTALSTVAALLARPLAGYKLDHAGRRGVLLVGIVIISSLTALYSYFPFVAVILAIRFLHGFGWGTSTTSSNTIATDVIPKRRFGEGMGYFTLSQSLSLALSPVIGLTIMDALGYRAMTFTAFGLLLVALIAAIIIRFPQVEKSTSNRFAPYERSAVRPTIVMVFVGIVIGSVFSFAALYGRSVGIDNVALFFTCYAIALFVVRPLIGRIIDRLGFNATVFPGFILMVASVIVLSRSTSLPVFLVAAVLQGMAYGTVQTSLQTMAVVNAPASRRGAANATFFTGFDAGIGIGGLSAGIIATWLGYSKMYFVMITPLLFGAVIYYVLARNIRKIPDDTEEESVAGNAL